MTEDNRNLLVFFLVSTLILIGYPHFFGSNQEAQITQQVTRQVNDVVQVVTPSSSNDEKIENVRHDVPVRIVKLDSQSMSGEISSCGVKINNVLLKDYNEKLNEKNKISVFGENRDDYFALTTWECDDKTVLVPNENTHWEVSTVAHINEKEPVVFSWDNGHGLIFEKHVHVDEKFVLKIDDKVKNYSSKSVLLKPVTYIKRAIVKDKNAEWSFHLGAVGYLNNKLEETSYEDIVKKSEIKHETKGGWYGITDKYWLVAFIPDQNDNLLVTHKHNAVADKNVYTIKSEGAAIKLEPKEEIFKVRNLFVGAKEIKTLDMYEEKLSAKHLDLAIDFGSLYFLTKPLLYALVYIKDLIGNMGIGIILLTLLIKLLLFPLANKSYRSMNKMKTVQPRMQALQKRYAEDKVKLGQEISDLYKKEGISPVGGCLPMLLQSPVLFALYKVLYISIEMRHAPFALWIHDLSIPDPMVVFTLFGLIPINLPDFLCIGIWPVLMGISMYVQQKMGPAPSDAAQANMLLIMPLMFTFMFAQLPSGLVIYWTFSNLFGMIQQYWFTKREAIVKVVK